MNLKLIMAMVLAALILLLLVVYLPARNNSEEISPSAPAGQVETNQKRQTTDEQLSGRNRIKSHHTNSVLTGKAAGGDLSPEEVVLIEEAFTVTSAMTEFLDDWDNTNALMEARLLVSHPNREVRMSALLAMQWIGVEALMDIISFFGDPDQEINDLAHEAFWEVLDDIGDPGLKLKMLSQLSTTSPNPEIRIEALDEMAFLPDHLSFPVMAGMLNDPVDEVREVAKENLSFISDEEFESEAEAQAWYKLNADELIELNSF